MTPPLYIALRFLTHRKRALLLSLSGVVFGVAIFICTQAQTEGFARHFIDSTIGSNGALVIKSRFRPRYEPLMVSSKTSDGKAPRRLYFEGITDANEIMRVSRQFSNVVSCSPVLRGTVSARAGFEDATVELYGIEPALHAQTTDLLHQLIAGNFDDFRNNTSAIIVGSRLAEILQAGVGDTVQLLSPNGEYWRFTVAAIARAGVGSIDATRVYSHARIAQTLLQRPFGARRLWPGISKRCFSMAHRAGRNARRARCNFF
jgi:lipoprotein-releasing system permease protein